MTAWSTWPADEITVLKALWAEGETCSAIARMLEATFHGGRTKNSIIGKAHRLGLPPLEKHTTPRQKDASREAAVRMRPKAVNVPRVRRRRAAQPRPVAAVPAPEAVSVPSAAPRPLRLPLLALEAHSCRYAVGENPDARGHGYLFCGNETVNGGAWCIHHRALVFTPAHRKPPSELVTPALQAGDAGGR